ncbi:glutathione S-transferase family protein [Aspergillus ellipticus CBS 707.79]|uniref:Glutathione S-transferase family protein n=1 Tax=Aspergillus ellipticus CBS 707.79 TaxID=1448320 RepID=A0A319E1R5_9EURO|nr:glutathione S-transferase family protein [Aspergillus ellipticus CBS 707.79]
MASVPFTLYTHAGPGPNPVKVAIALEHLGLVYNTIPLAFGEGKGTVKDPEYTSNVNPNGRVPALIDHDNGDFTVFESGTILRYLADKYDPSGKLGGTTVEERAEVNQWLAWQISGLGPYQGQLIWFLAFHEQAHGEKPGASVMARYQNEVERLRAVLEMHLASGTRDHVALGRLTIADFALLPWLKASAMVGPALKSFGEYPAIDAYVRRLDALLEVQAAYKKAVPAV